MTLTIKIFLSMILLGLLISCTNQPPEPTKLPPASIKCKQPRPQVCTEEYRPVCAARDTGIRCVTAPCPSEKAVTYSNACSACADAKVYSYRPGACQN